MNSAALPPSNPLQRAVVGHPVFQGLSALASWYGETPPLEELVRTVRAFEGPGFIARHSLVARRSEAKPGGVLLDDLLDRRLEDLRGLSEEERRKWEEEFERLSQIDAVHGTTLVSLSKRRVGEELPALEFTAASPIADFKIAGLLQVEASLTKAAGAAMRRAHEGDQRARAKAFRAALDGSWPLIEEIAGLRHPRNQQIPPVAIPHWIRVRRGITELLRAEASANTNPGPDWWLLWPRERAVWTELRGSIKVVTPAYLAAYFTWNRASRPGAVTTFARKVGVCLSREVANWINEALRLAGHGSTQAQRRTRRAGSQQGGLVRGRL